MQGVHKILAHTGKNDLYKMEFDHSTGLANGAKVDGNHLEPDPSAPEPNHKKD
jgi:hypothetical protein